LARLKGFQKLTPVDKALEIFLKAFSIRNPEAVSVPLDAALNRITAKTFVAEEDLPRFDRSAVDGYAVKAKDTAGASQFKPMKVTITYNDSVTDGEAKQVWTGTPIPRGADAVLMLENSKRTDNELEVWTALAARENVSRRGEDVKKGEIAVEAGVRLKPQHLGMLAAFGKARIDVFEKPRIAILVTGNELVEVGGKREANQIFDANRPTISALCRELGAEPIDLGIARDDLAEIVKKLEVGLEKADAAISTGGTSVGVSDLVPEAINRIGRPGVVVQGVAMRPAMPTALAVVDGKPVLVLSGNPVAAMVGFEVFARPLIFRLLGMSKEEVRPELEAKMTRKIASVLGRRTFVRVHVCERNSEYFAEPISARGSGVISTMTRANGYVVVPESREGLAEDETVTVHIFDSVESGD
jgi:molybdopterin molybdotransferase